MKDNSILIVVALLLLGVAFISLGTGEINIPFNEVLSAMINRSSAYNNQIIQNIRIPRTVAGMLIGATLSASGLLTSITMKNPLADSGILGIQAGATVGALFAILVLPGLIMFLPMLAFLGGFVAFLIIILASMRGQFSPMRVVLVGVAINAVATSIIGVITILNAHRIRNVLSWLNGSLLTVSRADLDVMLIYSLVVVVILFISMPIVKLLRLEDMFIINIGHNPTKLRILVSLLAVLLASISVAYVGIISFIGIIAPQIAKRLIDTSNLYRHMILSMCVGALIVVGSDVVSRYLFSPVEIPVGVLIGIVGAPIFVILAGGKNDARS